MIQDIIITGNDDDEAIRVACAFANSLLRVACKHGYTLTPLKLQQLLYIHYGELRAAGGLEYPLRFEAHGYGPVIGYVYDYYERGGEGEIKKRIKDREGKIISLADDTLIEGIKKTISHYGWRSTEDILAAIHAPDGAWARAYQRGKDSALLHTEIRDEFASSDTTYTALTGGKWRRYDEDQSAAAISTDDAQVASHVRVRYEDDEAVDPKQTERRKKPQKEVQKLFASSVFFRGNACCIYLCVRHAHHIW